MLYNRKRNTPRPQWLQACLEAMDGRRTLLFASDYPHWDQDTVASVRGRLPTAWRDNVFCDNALAVYPRLSTSLQHGAAAGVDNGAPVPGRHARAKDM